MLSRSLSLLFILLPCTCVLAQRPSIAALRAVIDTTESVDKKINLYTLIFDQVRRDTAAGRGIIDTMGQLLSQTDSAFTQGIYYRYKARYHDQTGEVEAGKVAIQKSIDAFKAIGDDEQLSKSYINYAMLFRAASNFAEIFRYSELSLQHARKVGAPQQIGIAYNTMGIAQRNIGNLEAATRYYSEATKYFEQINNIRALFSINLNLGSIQADKNNYDSAAYYSLLAIKYAEQQRPVNKYQLGVVHSNLASFYVKTNEKEKGLISAQKAYNLLKEAGGPQERAAAGLNYSQALLSVGKTDQVLPYMEEARNTIREYGIWQSEHVVYRAYGKYYAAKGNTDSVDLYFDKFAKAKDRDADTLRVGEIAKMEAQFQNQEQKAALERLKLEDELNQAKLRRQQWIIGGGLVVVGLLGSLLWWIFSQRKRIAAQNTVIRQALAEKDTLLKEIHHRVKNNLQMVSSLLSLQSDYVEEGAALDALQMGRSRVRSMALIHQKLYLGDTVSTQVDAKDYLERLVREVVDTHRTPDASIDVITEIDDLELDIDTIVPLGLI
ncbi:MAG: histidine kinase dimerization/phosphoacceptor domain -containing protein, partial [Bacteroidota bacterium]